MTIRQCGLDAWTHTDVTHLRNFKTETAEREGGWWAIALKMQIWGGELPAILKKIRGFILAFKVTFCYKSILRINRIPV